MSVMEQHIILKSIGQNRGTGKDNIGEEEAVFAFLKGREEGFDALFHRYYPPLRYLAQDLLGSHAAAEDIVSDSFVKLWERRGRLGTSGSIRAWLYTTVQNACIYVLRREKLKMLHLAYTKRSGEGQERPVLHRLIEAETLHRLHTALKTLPPKCGKVLRMYYLEEKSLQEIAAELNLSLSTVKSQKGRAVELLKKRVGGR